jgi:hypothetical protein
LLTWFFKLEQVARLLGLKPLAWPWIRKHLAWFLELEQFARLLGLKLLAWPWIRKHVAWFLELEQFARLLWIVSTWVSRIRGASSVFTRYTLVYFPCTDGAVHVLSQSSIMAHSWLSHSSLMNLSWPSHGSPMGLSWLPHGLLMALMALSSLTWALSVLLVPSLIQGSSIVRFESTAEAAEDYCDAK